MDDDEFLQDLTPVGRAMNKINGMTLRELVTTDDPDVLAAYEYVKAQTLRSADDHFCTSQGHC